MLLAVGILGATVMPHVIYLHSALMQNRIVPETTSRRGGCYRFTRVDVVIAMTIAGLINMAMLVDGGERLLQERPARCRFARRRTRDLAPILGGASSTLFALALLGSGLSSSAVGTLSGQVVMQGFVRRRIPIFVRRAVTMVPAFVVIAIGVDPSRTLVISQVVLSFGIPFALIPLVDVHEPPRRDGCARQPRATTTVAAALVAALISG